VRIVLDSHVRIELPGVPPPIATHALRHAADRLAALDRTLVVRSHGDGSLVEAPCGS
jgi:hypothetical protein